MYVHVERTRKRSGDHMFPGERHPRRKPIDDDWKEEGITQPNNAYRRVKHSKSTILSRSKHTTGGSRASVCSQYFNQQSGRQMRSLRIEDPTGVSSHRWGQEEPQSQEYSTPLQELSPCSLAWLWSEDSSRYFENYTEKAKVNPEIDRGRDQSAHPARQKHGRNNQRFRTRGNLSPWTIPDHGTGQNSSKLNNPKTNTNKPHQL